MKKKEFIVTPAVICAPVPMGACHCLVTWKNFGCHKTLSMLSYDTKHQFLQHLDKRPPFTKLCNNGQMETLTLCIPSLLPWK